MQAGGQIGGKGSVRRKKTAVHKTSTLDDKKLQTTLKRLQVNPIPNIEEVCTPIVQLGSLPARHCIRTPCLRVHQVVIYKEDATAIYFDSPKGE